MFLATVILLLSCIGIYLFKFKLVLFSVRSNTHMMAPLCKQITNLFSSTLAAIW